MGKYLKLGQLQVDSLTRVLVTAVVNYFIVRRNVKLAGGDMVDGSGCEKQFCLNYF